MTRHAAIALLAFLSTFLSACTVYRFSLEPRPPERGAARPSVGGTFSFEYQSEYAGRRSTPDLDEPFLLERLEATLREYGEFRREESGGGATHGLHLHVDVYQPFHGTPPPQAWLTGLTLGLIPSTGRSEMHREGVLARESRYSLWQRAYCSPGAFSQTFNIATLSWSSSKTAFAASWPST